jgi:hypothetical protein
MWSGLIGVLKGFFSGGVGGAVGNGVANFAALAALLPVALWFLDHKDEIAVSLTWGQLALLGLVLFFVVKIVHYTRAGSAAERI